MGINEAAIHRYALRAVPMLMVLTDRRGTVIDASNAMVGFLNVVREALLGKPLLHFVARQDTRRFRALVRELTGELVEPMPVRLRPRHGAPQAMIVMARQIRVALGDYWVWTAVGARG